MWKCFGDLGAYRRTYRGGRNAPAPGVGKPQAGHCFLATLTGGPFFAILRPGRQRRYSASPFAVPDEASSKTGPGVGSLFAPDATSCRSSSGRSPQNMQRVGPHSPWADSWCVGYLFPHKRLRTRESSIHRGPVWLTTVASVTKCNRRGAGLGAQRRLWASLRPETGPGSPRSRSHARHRKQHLVG